MKEHICVCICTYKRPVLLSKALNYIVNQTTANRFTFSIVVVDNDLYGSAKEVVSEIKADLVYDIEPVQNIALARNKAVKNASGDFFVFMDDDEFPSDNWLLNLYLTQQSFQSAGVLGPVKPYYEGTPPKWLISSGICERPDFKTGTILSPKFTRTGNVLIRSDIFTKGENLFNPEFGRVGGEDSDFFRRMIGQGYKFVWCREAIVFESVPQERWKRSFYIKRALLRGRSNSLHDKKLPLDKKTKRVLLSLVAFLGYSFISPFAVLSGEKARMKFIDRYFHHAGRLLTECGIQIVKER